MILIDDLAMRLAHYVPCSQDVSAIGKNDLILNTLFRSKKALTPGDISTFLAQDLGVVMNENDISDSLQQLAARGQVQRASWGYVLAEDTATRLQGLVETQEALEERVLSRWINEDLAPKYPLTSVEADQVRSDLVLFLNKLFLKHGVESIKLISGESQPLNGSNVEEEAMRTLPKRSEVIERLKKDKAFKEFLAKNDADRFRFLSNLISKAMVYLTVVCDPQVLSRLQERLKGKTIYLDTNVIYRLFGLQGDHREKVISAALKTVQEYGFEVRVLYMTLQELKRRIRFDSKVLRDYPIPRNLAAVGICYMTEENFVSTYWKARDTGVTVDDFIAFYSQPQVLLEDKGIVVEGEMGQLPEPVRQRQHEIESELRSLAATSEVDDYQKSDSAIEHDAYSLGFIEHLQGENCSFLDSPAWFMTCDKSLVGFDRSSHSRRGKPPLTILPSQAVQILRFTRSTEAYDSAFLGFFSRNFIGSALGISNEIIHELLGRVAKYCGTPELAARILSSELLIRRFVASTDSGERDEIVHEALLKEAEETEINLKKSEAEKKNLEQELARTEDKKRDLETLVKEKDAVIVQLKNDGEQKQSDLDELRRFRDRIVHLFLAARSAALVLLGAIQLVLVLLFLPGKAWLCLSIAAAGALVFWAVFLFWGRGTAKKAIKLAVLVLTVLSMIATIVGVFPDRNSVPAMKELPPVSSSPDK